MGGPPWDKRIARVFVKPLVRSPGPGCLFPEMRT
jgi:hypothetical protein